jgi:hypothetical protein
MSASSRFLSRVGAVGFFLVAGTNVPTDSTRHVYGYGGIVPVPPAVDASDSPIQTPDILNQRRIAVRTKNGRVLYANERVTTPATVDEMRTVASHPRHPCSQVVQSRMSAGPNS